MARARLYCTFVLLLYLKEIYGQQVLPNNQNVGVNNGVGLQQQGVQRAPNNINQIQNGGLNMNLAQQPNLQPANLQQMPALSGPKQGNMQQLLNLPPNLQPQNTPVPQTNMQITKMGFTPVTPGMVGNPSSQFQNTAMTPNVQVIQPQNMPLSNNPASQISNAPISTTTLAELAALKGHPSLLSLLNPQNNGQSQQNQQFVVSNGVPNQNQLTDVQKQFLMKALQGQTSGQNQQGINLVQAQPIVTNGDNQVTFHAIQGSQQQQQQAIVTPLGNQPAYITVQAQPLSAYLQSLSSTPQVIVEEEPSIVSMILSELSPQYTISPPVKKSSKTNLKTLIPLIINLLKERNNCGCRNCGCPNNSCQNGCPNITLLEPQLAQIFGGYSNQKKYGQFEDSPEAKFKKNDDDPSRNNDKERKNYNKNTDDGSEEDSEEDNSEYDDDEDE